GDAYKKFKSAEDIYLHVFAPKGVAKEDNYPLYERHSLPLTDEQKDENEKYKANKSVDIENNNDGTIQRSEILGRYNDSYSKGKTNKESNFICNKTESTIINAKGIITYHIYMNGEIEKHIPKIIDERFSNSYKYILHDRNNKQHEICIVEWHETDKRNNGKKVSSIPKGYIRTYDYPNGGNAQTAYVYQNEDIYVKGTKYGYRKYSKGDGKVILIRMKDSLNYISGEIKVCYKFSKTQRRYCNPDAYAGFIGALAKLNRTDISCTGMCFEDATSYPSLTHPNGDCADTSYYSTLEVEQEKVDAFKAFHFEKIYRGKGSWYSKLNGTIYSTGHEDHLHSGEFNTNKVTIIKEK
ncbi:hypothetical protein BWK59_14750, partial [Flavobacterium davisii]